MKDIRTPAASTNAADGNARALLGEDCPLLVECTSLLEACGLDDPMCKIYVTSHPLEGLPVFLLLFLLAYLPKVCVPVIHRLFAARHATPCAL